MSFVAAGTFACTFDIPDESEMKMMFEPSNSYDPNKIRSNAKPKDWDSWQQKA